MSRARTGSDPPQRRAHFSPILELFGEDSWRNLYAGELKVRPAFARRNHEGCPPKRIARRWPSASFGRQATRRAHHSWALYQKQLLCVTKAFVIKSRLCSRVSASIRRLDEHG